MRISDWSSDVCSSDLRVSTLPSRAGERVVLRILDKENAGMNLDLLGMAGAAARIFREGLQEPNGIILATGSTGSGKTTTPYAGLRQITDGTRYRQHVLHHPQSSGERMRVPGRSEPRVR